MEISDCRISNAGKAIGALKELQIIWLVKEKGNGIYVFVFGKRKIHYLEKLFQFVWTYFDSYCIVKVIQGIN